MRLNSWSQVSTITPSQSLPVISQILTRARKQGHAFISLPASAASALHEKVPFLGRSTFYHSGSNIPVLRLHHRGGQGREEKNQKQPHSHHHPTTQPLLYPDRKFPLPSSEYKPKGPLHYIFSRKSSAYQLCNQPHRFQVLIWL